MNCKLLDLNCKDKEYKFNMSTVSEKDWLSFAHSVVLEKGENVKDLHITGCKIVIRDNKARFKVFYQDSNYHELEYHLDEFGRVSKKYQDIVSSLWQGVMSKYYGNEYNSQLELKLNLINQAVQN